MAACTPSASPNINLECGGSSTNSATLVNHGNDPGTAGDAGNMAISLAPGSVLVNSGTITVDLDTPLNNTAGTDGYQRTRLYGISGGDIGVYEVTNAAAGVITVTHGGTGRAWGIAGNGDATEMHVVNEGAISVIRGPLTLSSVQSGSLQGRASSLASGNQTIDIAAAVYSEEELEADSTINRGSITASGTLAAGIYSRAEESTIENYGTITNAGGIAIAKVSDSNETRTLELKNAAGATITGDILAVNGHALRWWGLSTGLGTGGQGLDNRLNINSQAGIVDSEIDNAGIINGDVYLGNGTHVLANEDTGVIDGDIDVDQRATVNVATTNLGARIFSFENAGSFKGDVTVRNTAGSTVILLPHIFGGGDGSSAADPSGNSAFIDGTLHVYNATGGASTLAATTTIKPVIDGLVKDGEWYKVAEHITASSGDLPTVVGTSALVTWTADTTAGAMGDTLAIGAEVADSAAISGLSRPGAATLDALLGSSSTDPAFLALGGAIQSLESAEGVRKAAEQLAPDTSFSTQQSALTLTSLIGGIVDGRIASGWSGSSSGSAFTAPSGLGMGSGAPKPSYLGGNAGEGGSGATGGNAGLWGQGFAAQMEQGATGRVSGYDAEVAGLAFGYDTRLSAGSRVGAAFAYASTNIGDNGDREGNHTDANSYTGLVYGALGGSGWYLTGQTGYTWHDYDTRRELNVGLDDVATGSHNGSQYHMATEAGAPMRIGSLLMIPVASLDYNWLDQDGYTERSAGGMALAVDGQETESLVSGLGLKVISAVGKGIDMQGRAIWLHELLDTNQSVSARFAAADLQFSAAGPNVERDTANLGASLVFGKDGPLSLTIDYDSYLREDFVAHAGSGRLRAQF